MKYLSNKIFLTAIIFSILIFTAGIIAPDDLLQFLQNTNTQLLEVFSDWYLWLALLIVIITFIIFLLPIGKQKLGNDKPEYSFFSWIALLYSTGMGSGLLLRAVQEPVYYFNNPPVENGMPAHLALEFSFFHWGITPWAMYSLFGLIVAYNLYKSKSPNYLQAVLADQKNKSLAKIINIFIALITIVGVIASLGFGAAQFMGGLNHVFNWNLGQASLLLIVFGIGLVATLSALTGIKKVIKILADFDLSVSILIMLFVALFLDFGAFSTTTIVALKNYVLHFFEMSLSTGTYNTSDAFTNDWTVFYWAFWIAWVPFTGIFIARISKGRTIRQYLLATIIIPALATMIWFSVLGNMAFQTITELGIYSGQYDNIFTSLFIFLENFPLSKLTVIITALLVLTAIINSVDSAIFVLSMFSDEGNENPNKTNKILWGIIITATALGMTSVGANHLLDAISSLLIIMALPFSFLYLLLIGNFIMKLLKH